MLDLVTGLAATLSAGGTGILGYFVRKFDKRLTNSEMCGVRNKIALEKKFNREDTKELINDKLGPIHVILKNIEDDVQEIKNNLREIK